ncbi:MULTISPECIES: hypothetical protein [Thermus]|uniref:hypothetical protein n=1 Tax=Thermus TaxID=270 RepID=UPI001F408D9C|nr:MULTISPECIES: hypothetical protein [Thermus]
MNPMPVFMYLLGVDAAQGLLEALGYRKAPHPKGVGSSLYLGEEAVLHSTGLWYRGVLYLRPKERFYRASLPPYPPEVAPQAEPLPFGEGLAHYLPFIQAHEERVRALRGEGRERLLRHLPPVARRHLKEWKSLWRSDEEAARP